MQKVRRKGFGNYKTKKIDLVHASKAEVPSLFFCRVVGGLQTITLNTLIRNQKNIKMGIALQRNLHICFDSARGVERRHLKLYQADFFIKTGNAQHRVIKKSDKKATSYFHHLLKLQFITKRYDRDENLFE